jgi:hypothetical protein
MSVAAGETPAERAAGDNIPAIDGLAKPVWRA